MCLALATVLSSSPIQAVDCALIRQTPPKNWEKLPETSKAFISQVRLSGGKKVQASVRIKWPFPPDGLFSTVWNYNDFQKFIPGVGDSTVLHREKQRVWVYQRLVLPGPLHDRHYIMLSTHTKSSQSHFDQYVIDWRLDDHFPLPSVSGTPVVPLDFQGCWDIRTGLAGGLDATYAIEIDLGGLIPNWLARAALRQYLINLMDALYQRLNTKNAQDQSSDR
jgi:hypothetical protein